MSTILDTIADAARKRTARSKPIIPAEEMVRRARAMNPDTGFPFEKALKKPGLSFICECKKASPSKGLISRDFPYLSIAREYEQAEAAAISVLTEPEWFLGNDEILSVKKYLHIHDPSIAAILDSYGQTVQSFGQIVSVIPKTSKSGRAYCRLLVSDGMSDVTINVWPSDYAQLKDSLAPGIYVRFHGKMGDNGAVQADKLATVHRE